MPAMPDSLDTPAVRAVLDRLFAAAQAEDGPILERIAREHQASAGPLTAAQQSEVFGEAYIPVAPETGRLLYSLIRAARPQTVIEFGSSFGISTIHLAAAVADNGTGRVISTELNPAKAERARDHLAEAGLAGVTEIITGDARQTLAAVPGPVGFVLLDGWKQLYLDLLHLLEPALAPGALVAADDTDSFAWVLADYLAYVRDPANGYVSTRFPIGDGLELSLRC
jgi:predicted O-methyltransferase YrrM